MVAFVGCGPRALVAKWEAKEVDFLLIALALWHPRGPCPLGTLEGQVTNPADLLECTNSREI